MTSTEPKEPGNRKTCLCPSPAPAAAPAVSAHQVHRDSRGVHRPSCWSGVSRRAWPSRKGCGPASRPIRRAPGFMSWQRQEAVAAPVTGRGRRRPGAVGKVVDPGQSAQVEALAGAGDRYIGQAGFGVGDGIGCRRGSVCSSGVLSLGRAKSSAMSTRDHSRPFALWAVETVTWACGSGARWATAVRMASVPWVSTRLTRGYRSRPAGSWAA